MPSHTFTRVGDWDASIETNIKSAESARKSNAPGEVLHALDYMTYAYLQTAQDHAAKRVLDEMQSIGRSADNSGGYGTAGAFAMAAIAARYALERQDWTEAKALVVRPVPQAPFTDAMTRFARALGFARSGDATSAQGEVAELEKLRDALTQMKDAYWAGQVEIERLGASAWAARAEGRNEEALSLLRSAAEKEDATEKSAITPGPIKPAREQLGELLLASDQPALALKEFEATLTREPRRFLAVYGAARAAQLSGDHSKADGYYKQLVDICAHADSERPDLLEARRAALKQ
jgi:tetratricopeptide (TPR) repeat protein